MTDQQTVRVSKATISVFRAQIYTVSAVLFLTFVIIAAVAVTVNHSITVNRQATRCVLDELVEHRASSLVHEYQTAQEAGESFQQPLGIQSPSQAAVEAARSRLEGDCAPFLPRGVGQLEPVPSTSGPGVTDTTLPAAGAPPTSVGSLGLRRPVNRRSTTSRATTTSRGSTPATTRPSAPPSTTTPKSCAVPFAPCPLP